MNKKRAPERGTVEGKRHVPPGEVAPRWEIILAWVLKVMIALTAGAEFVFGSYLFGLWGLFALAVAVLPVRLARTYKVVFPVEFQIVLLLILVADVTFGKFFQFYERLEYFDKLLHYNNSVLVSFLGFLLVYAFHFTGRLKVSVLIGGIVILLVTLGLGALWEVLEYVSDRIFGLGAQGSPKLEPLDDTMFDLILDFFGGIFGAVFGSIYIRYSKRTRRRQFVAMMTALGGS